MIVAFFLFPPVLVKAEKIAMAFQMFSWASYEAVL